VLASPEAAQQHIDEWKKNLEETAQGVRAQVVAQTEAEAEAASRRWHEELEAMLAGSSQKLGERLSEVSQAALASTERDVEERSSSLRALIDEVVSGAESAVLSLGAELAQQRAETENSRMPLRGARKKSLPGASSRSSRCFRIQRKK
jgi:predicted regulator of Ras-like GTPase activity (Roadblock/LC7/MglB family)